MRNRITVLLLLSMLSSHIVCANNFWKRADNKAAKSVQHMPASVYLVYAADEQGLKSELLAFSNNSGATRVIALPMADGSMKDFEVRSSSMMPARLASRYPHLRTFNAVAVDDASVTAKLDFTVYGFHAMIFNGSDVSFIDPAGDLNSGYYTVHFKKDEVHAFEESSRCETEPGEPVTKEQLADMMQRSGARTGNGHQLRTYRLALSCSHQYATTVTSIAVPTIAQVFSKMLTTMNRVNGVYERELSVTMKFVDNEDTLIWNTESTGPNGPDSFSTINASPSACLIKNQKVCDNRIGSANYDLGHVFTTNAGGYSQIGIICKNLLKAQSVTGQPNPSGDGFDIDYVAHEMGHEFGADHVFNNGLDNSCAGSNINPTTAYEPGSGSTIMAYAGICKPDNIQPHSDAYFHAISLIQIRKYITTGGDACAVKSETGNKLVYLPPFTAAYTIPFLTPFELTAPAASDSVSSTSITYCWEQWDLGSTGQRFVNTQASGPIFRSYAPVKSPVRVFPKDTMVLAGVLSNAGQDNAQGEKAPEVARALNFKLTMRNVFQGYGCFLIPDDSIHLEVINSGAGFKVTSQAEVGATYVGGSTQTITWDVVGTNNPPVSATNVDIYMSEDGGYSWKHQIGTFPNTGTASVPLPNPDATALKCRIKVKGANNVFFNVNKSDFAVTHSDGTDTTIRLYPVPVRNTLRVSSGNKGLLQFRAYNSIGQLVFADQVNGLYDIPVSLWGRGMYVMKLVDTKGQVTVKKFVVD